LLDTLKTIADEENIVTNRRLTGSFFRSLISRLYSKYGRKVAVLTDECDWPVPEGITSIRLAEKIRKTLRKFCNVLKAAGEQ
jgi:hypothetical protein